MSSPDSERKYTPVRNINGKRIVDALLLFSGGEAPLPLREQLPDREQELLGLIKQNDDLRYRQERFKKRKAEQQAENYERKLSQEDNN